MPQILELRGGPALSAFRLEKLNQRLAALDPELKAVSAEFWHLVEITEPLSEEESRVLARLLEYGDAPPRQQALGEFLLVVPRFGTVSPWASKATDIAHNCGLASAPHRARHRPAFAGGRIGPRSLARSQPLAARPHDRERCCVASTRPHELFDELSRRGRWRRSTCWRAAAPRWSRPTRASAWRSSDDEIDYLVDALHARWAATRPTSS